MLLKRGDFYAESCLAEKIERSGIVLKQSTRRHGTKIEAILRGFGKGFSLLLVYELIEELIEELIAWSITTMLAKAISFLLVVVLTQTTKVATKTLVVVLKPAVKKIDLQRG